MTKEGNTQLRVFCLVKQFKDKAPHPTYVLRVEPSAGRALFLCYRRFSCGRLYSAPAGQWQ